MINLLGEMDFKVLKLQVLRGRFARRLLFKTLLFALAMALFLFFEVRHEIQTMDSPAISSDGCSMSIRLNPYSNLTGFSEPVSCSRSTPCKEDGSLEIVVFKELMEKDLLNSGANALCVGEKSNVAVLALRKLGFLDAFGVYRHPFFSLMKKGFICELDFKDNEFDFVFSRGVDKVSVPALLVLEIERVLRPGGVGAMLVSAYSYYSRGLIRPATLVSSFLKSSDVVQVCGISSFTLVIFKKKIDNVALFEHYRLPTDCPSVASNKPLMEYLEPLLDQNLGPVDSKFSYLSKFMNISSRKRSIYINIGAGGIMNSIWTDMFKTFHPLAPRALEAYVIDHDVSVLSTYVQKPGVNFVYHPGLGEYKDVTGVGSKENSSTPLDEEEFDFITWFNRTVLDGDFVVLLMNAKTVEIRILFELFESGAICYVDEVFIGCSDGVDCRNAVCGDCMSLFSSLRKSGVFVHRLVRD